MDRILIPTVFLAFIAEPALAAGTADRCGSMQDGAARLSIAAASSSSTAPVTTATVSPRIELIEAAKRAEVATVRQLVDTGTSELDARDGFGRSALHYAARLGHQVILGILIGAGAPLEAKDADGFTPLLRAIQGGDANIDAVRLLLDAGADRDARAGDLGADELARSVGATDVRKTLAR